MTEAIEIRLEIDERAIVCVVINSTDAPVNVWDRNNSWGWETVVLRVARPDQPAGSETELRPRPRVWTRNGPGVVEIPPAGEHAFALAPSPSEWDGTEAVTTARDTPLVVHAVLQIPPSPEAAELGVFVGDVQSPAVTSSPPHAWLADDEVADDEVADD